MSVLAPPSPPVCLARETVEGWAVHMEEGCSGSRRYSPSGRRTGGPWPLWRGCVAQAQIWQRAEVNGAAHLYGFPHLLGRATKSPAAVREALSAYVLDCLGDPQGLLIVDEKGFLQKGSHAAGVARPYSGTAGRIENCLIGVLLA